MKIINMEGDIIKEYLLANLKNYVLCQWHFFSFHFEGLFH